MAASGMALMLRTLGLDPEEMKASAEGFMSNMKQQAETINGNQRRIETRLEEIDGKLDMILETAGPKPSTVHILENGHETGVLITDEKFPQQMIDDVNRG